VREAGQVESRAVGGASRRWGEGHGGHAPGSAVAHVEPRQGGGEGRRETARTPGGRKVPRGTAGGPTPSSSAWGRSPQVLEGRWWAVGRVSSGGGVAGVVAAIRRRRRAPAMAQPHR